MIDSDGGGVHPDLVPDEAIDTGSIKTAIESELAKLKATEIEYQKLSARAPDYKGASAELKQKIEAALKEYTERLNGIQQNYSKSMSVSYSRIKALKEAAALDQDNGVFQQSVRDEQEKALKLIKDLSKNANTEYQTAVQSLRNLKYSDQEWNSGAVFGKCASAPCVRMLKKDLEEWTNFVDQMNVSVDMDRLVHSEIINPVTRSKIYSPKRPVVTEALLNFAKKKITSPLMPANEACTVPEIAVLSLKKAMDAGIGIVSAVGTIPVFFGEGMVKVGTEIAKMLDTKFSNVSLDLEEVDFDTSTASRINGIDKNSEELARQMPSAFFDNEYENAVKAGTLRTAKDYSLERQSSLDQSRSGMEKRFNDFSGSLDSKVHKDGYGLNFQGIFQAGDGPQIMFGLNAAYNSTYRHFEGELEYAMGYRRTSGTAENGSDLFLGASYASAMSVFNNEDNNQIFGNFLVPMPDVTGSVRTHGITLEGKLKTSFWGPHPDSESNVRLGLVTSGKVSIPIVSLNESNGTKLQLVGKVDRFMQYGYIPFNRFSLGIGVSR